MSNHSVSLTDLARLGARMSADSNSALSDLQERDHNIGSSFSVENKLSDIDSEHQNRFKKNLSPKWSLKLLTYWLDKTEPLSPSYLSLQKKEPTIALWMFMIGWVCGVIALSGLVFVDAKQPVNVLLFLTLFIGVQWAFLVLTVLVGMTALFNLSALHLPFENFNPAKLLFGRVIKQFSKKINSSTSSIAWELFSDVIRLSLLRWGQLFGMAFNLGGLIAFFVVLAFTDRNFGWSSTFNISDDSLFSFFDVISTPWKYFLPEATLTADIVRDTRFHFLQSTFSGEQVESMRAWWPFLFATIFVYGLLPRVVLWVIFKIQAAKKSRQVFMSYPGVRLVLDRMVFPVVTTQSHTAEGSQIISPKISKQPAINLQETISIIDWAGALSHVDPDRFLSMCGFKNYDIQKAGLDLNLDETLLASFHKNTSTTIVIAVKSWEPPLEELRDFLRDLMESTKASTIYLLLVPLKKKAITVDEESDWRQFVSSVPASTSRLWVLKGGDAISEESLS